MAKRFTGFTPDQQFTLLKGMGYNGSPQQDEMDNFMAASPQAATQMGQYSKMAQQQLDGKPISPTSPQNFANGGLTAADIFRASDTAGDFVRRRDLHATTSSPSRSSAAPAPPAQQQTARVTELPNTVVSDPAAITRRAEVGQVQNVERGIIDPAAGQAGAAPQVDAAQAGPATEATVGDRFDPAQVEAVTVADDVRQATDDLQAARQDELSQTVDPAEMDPETLAQLNLQAEQANQTRVEQVNPRELQPGEAVSGSAVDMQAAEAALQVEAAQANPSQAATVRGQLSELMQDFEGGQTPPWAAGAMRQANAAMAARGLGASSMAGQAIIQATMEAAIPIAQADAQTYAQFELTNLNNRQQTVMFAAQERAKFLGQKFDQEFQTRVLNAQKISDIANVNFTAEQQVALENARLAQSTNLANMNARNAKQLADAAAMSQMELANLNNRQQAQVQNAQNFLQLDLANLSNEQQTAIFRTQQNVAAMFNDQAAENAAQQFNAASENQVNQFFTDLQATVSQFNAEQKNAMAQFDVNQENAVNQFNANLQAERENFNASNSLIIAQANAQWRQNVSTQEFAAQTQANLQFAQSVNNLTQSQLDATWQRERDIMAYAFQGAENAADRSTQILLADKQIAQQQQGLKRQDQAAFGALAADLLSGLF